MKRTILAAFALLVMPVVGSIVFDVFQSSVQAQRLDPCTSQCAGSDGTVKLDKGSCSCGGNSAFE